jgi:hypothetical protein
MIDAAIRNDTARIVNAGYNVKGMFQNSISFMYRTFLQSRVVVLMGPEEPQSVLERELHQIDWTVMGVGFGVRGSKRDDVTSRFEGEGYLNIFNLPVKLTRFAS